MNINKIIRGHVLDALRSLPEKIVQCCITSPPYFNQRDYGTPDQLWGGSVDCDHDRSTPRCWKCDGWIGTIGLELLPDCLGWSRGENCKECFVCHLRMVFSEVKRVMTDDGTLWLNLGDSYAGSGKGRDKDGNAYAGTKQATNKGSVAGKLFKDKSGKHPRGENFGLKPKDLMGIPWRTALALQADGWTLRNEIIWSKLSPMPEAVQDRCTRSHEHIFLLSKSRDYYYDHEAVAEKATTLNVPGTNMTDTRETYGDQNGGNEGLLNLRRKYKAGLPETRNRRTVWTIGDKGGGAEDGHFASYPEELVAVPILAGTQEGDIVLDPFFGSGTTGLVALKAKRSYIGIELSEKYVAIAKKRLEREESQLKLL